MITGRIQWDDREFRQALRDCIATSKRSVAEVVNSRALAVIDKAYKNTHHSDAAKIQAELGATGTRWAFSRKTNAPRISSTGHYVPKKGRASILFPGEVQNLKTNRVTKRGKKSPLTLAHKIVLRKLWDRAKGAGDTFGTALRWAYEDLKERGLTTKKERSRMASGKLGRFDLDELARRLIASRKGRVGYVRSGWLGSLQELWDYAKILNKSRLAPSRPQMRREVWGVKHGRKLKFHRALATENDPVCWIVNTAMGQRDKQPHFEPEKYAVAEEGLRKGLASELAEMRRHMELKMSETLRAYSAK